MAEKLLFCYTPYLSGGTNNESQHAQQIKSHHLQWYTKMILLMIIISLLDFQVPSGNK
jgi:hypothetical protein